MRAHDEVSGSEQRQHSAEGEKTYEPGGLAGFLGRLPWRWVRVERRARSAVAAQAGAHNAVAGGGGGWKTAAGRRVAAERRRSRRLPGLQRSGWRNGRGGRWTHGRHWLLWQMNCRCDRRLEWNGLIGLCLFRRQWRSTARRETKWAVCFRRRHFVAAAGTNPAKHISSLYTTGRRLPLHKMQL